MRINQLGADEFARSMAMIGEAVETVAKGGVGKELLAELVRVSETPILLQGKIGTPRHAGTWWPLTSTLCG